MYKIYRIRAEVYEDGELRSKLAKDIEPIITDNLMVPRRYLIENIKMKGNIPDADVKVFFEYETIK